MKLYKNTTVFDEALIRINWLFDEFEDIAVGFSGGKDSTVVLNLCLKVAEERNRLPLTVMFIDQEAEWQHTIDYMKTVMYDPRVNPRWYQMPMRIFNATSQTDHWLQCWDPKDKDLWIHEQEPIAITENVYGTDRFHDLFPAIAKVEYPDKPFCYIAGMRADENPKRYVSLTTHAVYKWATWGTTLNKSKKHYTMYPIYDWASSDIWKAITNNGWDFNRIYEQMYGYGIPLRQMRVSNLHHETAIHSLFHLQEIEPKTWNKMTKRLAGIDTAGKMGKDDFIMRELPFMFKDWREYRDYLLENLITDPEYKKIFAKAFARHDEIYEDYFGQKLYETHVSTLLCQDFSLTKLSNFDMAEGFRARAALATMNPDYKHLYSKG